ncbi:hypothetical protein IGI04_031938 [Brassica rapa subsp. trilocularis]|uniref:DUF4005 domain-containing protein n=1 Tax=Brassica rapa subsp. trilocularis TaxID=1813537 RepID=A0ABQ7LV07_BRACM|nr:hypothetical protein IGI04_031938 [Brassica rapa subsp. trilocularis]
MNFRGWKVFVLSLVIISLKKFLRWWTLKTTILLVSLTIYMLVTNKVKLVRKDSPRHILQCKEITSSRFESLDSDISAKFLNWKEATEVASSKISFINLQVTNPHFPPRRSSLIPLLKPKKETYAEEGDSYRSGKQLTTDHHYRGVVSLPNGGGRAETISVQRTGAFHERIDRHGNSFGARVATKQTRVPPPTAENTREETYSWRSKALGKAPEDQRGDPSKQKPFPQKGLSEWRKKPNTQTLSKAHTDDPNATTSHDQGLAIVQGKNQQESSKEQTEEQIINELNEATLLYLSCPDPTEAAARRQRVLAGDAKGQTEETAANLLRLRGAPREHGRETPQNHHNPVTISKEHILQELQEVTKQYLSCVDPVEASARRQRVLAGDAEGLLDKTANSILAVSTEQRRPLSPWERGIRSESPPGIDFDLAMQPSDVEVTPPHAMRRIEDGPILRNQSNRAREGAYPEKLKSIVVSPKGVMGEGAEALESAVEVADDEETLQNFQSKTKSMTTKQAKGAKAPTQMTGRKRGRPSKPKPTVASPNQLTGATLSWKSKEITGSRIL